MEIGIVFAGVSALVLLAGIASIYYGRKNRRLAAASASWPHTPGTVTRLDVIERERQTSDSSYTVYRPTIEYTYEVAGTTYKGQRLGFGATEVSSRGAAQKLLAPYAVGGPTTVFYDPSNPNVATLSTTAAGSRASIVIGFLLALAGLAGTLVGLSLLR